jgi:hypothetical protein
VQPCELEEVRCELQAASERATVQLAAARSAARAAAAGEVAAAARAEVGGLYEFNPVETCIASNRLLSNSEPVK